MLDGEKYSNKKEWRRGSFSVPSKGHAWDPLCIKTSKRKKKKKAGILRKKKPGILLSRTPVWGNKWLWLFSAETRPLESGFYKAANPCWESSHWEGKLRYRRSHWVGDILMLTWGWGQANQRGEKGDSSVQMGAQTHESTRLFHKDHGEKSPMILSCFPSFLSQIDF